MHFDENVTSERNAKNNNCLNKWSFDGFWYMRMQTAMHFCLGLLVGSVWEDTSWNNRRASLPCAPKLPRYPFSSCSHCSHCCVWQHHNVLEFSYRPTGTPPPPPPPPLFPIPFTSFPVCMNVFCLSSATLCMRCLPILFWTWPEHAYFLMSALL